MVYKGQHLIGKVLGSCILEKLLGYGGSSAVFLAQQRQPARKVAVKVFLPRAEMDARRQRDFYRRFLREAEAASKLVHNAILPIYAYGEQDGLPYIVMPYMSGGTLSEYMAKRGPLSLKEAQWYLEQLSAALDYAHEQGCIHCDVKPANILLDSDGHVMLSDFGIARLAKTDIDPEQTEATNQEALMGTPDYISPEQALGRPVDGRTDIYSLGITLFFVLAKRLPFRADSTIALALQHVHESPPSLALLRADITPLTDRVIRKALAKDPKDRYQSSGEFCIAFAEAIRVSQSKSGAKASLPGLIPDEDPFAEIRPLPTAPHAVVRIKPVWQNRVYIQRLLLICGVLLLISTSIAFVVAAQAPYAARNDQKNLPITATAQVPSTTPLPENLLASSANWPSSSTYFFDKKTSQYHVINKSASGIALAPYSNQHFRNFRLTISMRAIQYSEREANYYGIVFRVRPDQSQYYLFEITGEDDGQYLLQRFSSQSVDEQRSGDVWDILDSGHIPNMDIRKGAKNVLTLEVREDTIKYRINNHILGSAKLDSQEGPLLIDGLVGVFVESEGLEVAFSDLYIEKLE